MSNKRLDGETMEQILVICKDYREIKSEMNRISKEYEQFRPFVKLTDRTIKVPKIDYLFIFKAIGDYPEKIMGITINQFWYDESTEIPEEMMEYLKAHIRKKKT